MAKIEITPEQERLAKIAKALGHPTRVAIVCFLAKREECYFGDIADVLNIAKPTVSQHLKELKEAGLIQGEVMAPKVRYCVNCEVWEEAQAMFSQFFNGCACKTNKNCCK
ncbi:MAG: winged helix-turn-helix transcriptional regulator [Muribaculaceae bacterium]|nr:winged helix-turn-helix transcriptional regulator [Muribaculaceae bacterium]